MILASFFPPQTGTNSGVLSDWQCQTPDLRDRPAGEKFLEGAGEFRVWRDGDLEGGGWHSPLGTGFFALAKQLCNLALLNQWVLNASCLPSPGQGIGGS